MEMNLQNNFTNQKAKCQENNIEFKTLYILSYRIDKVNNYFCTLYRYICYKLFKNHKI